MSHPTCIIVHMVADRRVLGYGIWPHRSVPIVLGGIRVVSGPIRRPVSMPVRGLGMRLWLVGWWEQSTWSGAVCGTRDHSLFGKASDLGPTGNNMGPRNKNPWCSSSYQTEASTTDLTPTRGLLVALL